MMFAGVLGWVRRAAHKVFVFGALALPAVSLPAAGSSITLAWNASTDPTVAGYKVYFGAASGTYTNSADAGATTSASISNLVGGTTYYFAATTYNNLGVESAYSAETSYALALPSPPPTLNAISNLVINENSPQVSINLTGISSGSKTPGTLTVTAFSSNPAIVPNPTINYVSPNGTGTLSVAPVANAFGQVTITVMVDNGASVSNTVIQSFTITVNQINNPPTLNPINNMVISENAGLQTVNLTGITTGASNEIQTLTITAVSSNPGLVPNPTVNYISPNSTGTLTFTPVANAFGGATITVSVSDGQPTNSVTAQSFTVTVNQTILTQNIVTNTAVLPNTSFRYILTPSHKGDLLNFSIGAGAPAGAKLVPQRNGVTSLVWTPTSAQASTTNYINVVVNDVTTPALSTNEVCCVVVLDFVTLGAGSTAVQAGQTATVPIYVGSSDGVTNVTFAIGWPTNRFSNPQFSAAQPGISTNSISFQGTNLVCSFSATGAQPLQGGSNLLAFLSFRTTTNQHSAFVNLPVGLTGAIKPGSLNYSNCVPQAGQVVVVSDVPLLSGNAASGRNLNLYGKVNTQYQLQYATNYAASPSWYPVLTYTQTNVAQPASFGTASPYTMYRLVQQ